MSLEDEALRLVPPVLGQPIVLDVTSSSVTHDLQTLMGAQYDAGGYWDLQTDDNEVWYALSNDADGEVDPAARDALATKCWYLPGRTREPLILQGYRYLHVIAGSTAVLRLRPSSKPAGE